MERSQEQTRRRLEILSKQLDELAQTVADQNDALAGVPALGVKVEQCIRAYRSDEIKGVARLARARQLLDAGRVASHVREAVVAAPLELDPFPHVVIDGLLPEQIYSELVAAIPHPIFFRESDAGVDQLGVPFTFAPAHSREVWGFFVREVIDRALAPALADKFQTPLDDLVRSHWPDCASMTEAGFSLIKLNSRLLMRGPGYEIKPHWDPRWAFMTCLAYLPGRSETAIYGTELYRLKEEREAPFGSPFYVDRDECDLVREVPGIANSALVFLNGAGVHGASIPADAPAVTQRFIYQMQLGPDADARSALLERLPEQERARWTTKA